MVEPEKCIHPHFHLTNFNNGSKTAIKLNENKYFVHDKYDKKLNEEELKNLILILSSLFKNIPEVTVWQYLCLQWCGSHLSIPYKKEDIPDYLSMTESV